MGARSLEGLPTRRADLRKRVSLLLAAGGLAASFAPAGRALDVPLERAPTRLLGLSAEASDGGVRLRVHTDGRPGRVAVFALEDPRRLVIDLFDLREAETPERVPGGIPQIAQLRVGRHPERIRIVADAGAALASFEPVVTQTLPDGLVVEVAFPRGEDALDPPGDGTRERELPVLTAPPTRDTRTAAAPAPLLPRAVQEVQSAHGGVDLELEAGRTRVGGSIPPGMDAWERWKGEDEQRLAMLGDWEPGALAHNRIRVGLFDGRVRLTTRYARSRYDASAGPLAGSLYGRDLDRLLDPAGAVGEAFSSRLDGTLFAWGPARVEGFASFQRVDPLFAWNEKKGGKQDSFARSNRRMLEAGGVLRGGPFGLSLSRISEQADTVDLRSDRRPRRWSHRAVLSGSLEPLRQLDPSASEHALWSLAPDSAWVSLAEGSVEASGTGSEAAATRDLSAGLSWGGERSSATLSLWRSSFEGAGSAADWSGSGADLGYGLYRDRWDLYAGLGAQRSRTDQPGYRSSESSLAGFVSLSLRPERLLPVSATLTVDRYDADYGGSPLRTESFGLQTGLDLSELLFPIQPALRAHLRASYGAVWSRTRSGDADPELVLDHGPAVAVGFDF